MTSPRRSSSTTTLSETSRSAIAAVDKLADSGLELLRARVQCDTTTGWEDRVLPVYEQWFARHGWRTTMQPISERPGADGEPRSQERFNLIARRGGADGSGCSVVLNGHLDVIPVPDADEWTFPPFDATRDSGRIYGRGSCDMEGGIASGLIALGAVDSLDLWGDLEPVVQLVVGEETTGIGTSTAADDSADAIGAIFLEPTGGRIVPVNSGVFWFTVRSTGKAAHSSSPWHGVDAFDRLMNVRDRLIAFAEERTATHRHPLFADRPTSVPLAIGLVRSGVWRAAVPDQAEFTGRIGIAPGEDPDQLKADFEAVVAGANGPAPDGLDYLSTIVWLRVTPPWDTDLREPIVSGLVAAQRLLRGTGSLIGFISGSDAAILAARGIPTVVFGPGDVALAHAPNEFVTEHDAIECARTVALGLLDVAGHDAAVQAQ
jgi:acetylornithine deacetylase